MLLLWLLRLLLLLPRCRPPLSSRLPPIPHVPAHATTVITASDEGISPHALRRPLPSGLRLRPGSQNHLLYQFRLDLRMRQQHAPLHIEIGQEVAYIVDVSIMIGLHPTVCL
ncbi:unnamed protein product [Ectocarpus sp. CCAP 1310/34]|nr:unnamed protein product [Ectocarpus sp. CCAP 1310/34]